MSSPGSSLPDYESDDHFTDIEDEVTHETARRQAPMRETQINADDTELPDWTALDLPTLRLQPRCSCRDYPIGAGAEEDSAQSCINCILVRGMHKCRPEMVLACLEALEFADLATLRNNIAHLEFPPADLSYKDLYEMIVQYSAARADWFIEADLPGDGSFMDDGSLMFSDYGVKTDSLEKVLHACRLHPLLQGIGGSTEERWNELGRLELKLVLRQQLYVQERMLEAFEHAFYSKAWETSFATAYQLCSTATSEYDV